MRLSIAPRPAVGSSGSSYAQLSALDASGGRPDFAGVGIPTLEEVLEVVPPSVEMNVHINPGPTDCVALTRVVCAAMVRRGRLESSFVTGNEDVMDGVLACEPRVRRCMGSRPPEVWERYGCYGVQPTHADTDAGLCAVAHAVRLDEADGIILPDPFLSMWDMPMAKANNSAG